MKILNKSFWFSVAWVYASITGSAQQSSELKLSDYREVVRLRLNSSVFVVGETLLFSVDCFDASYHPSALSTVVSIELIDDNGIPVLQTKISLSDSHGAGDFFLPSTLMSGNYMLIAYTNWMRNFSLAHFYRKQITVLNPFRKPRSSVKPGKLTIDKGGDLSSIDLSFEKKSFTPRERVRMNLSLSDTSSALVSVSVRKIDPLADSLAAINATSALARSPSKDTASIKYLPELRGNLLGGVVRQNGNLSPASTLVYLSVPARAFLFLAARTDSSGHFYFNTSNVKFNTEVVARVDSTTCTDCKITFDSQSLDNYSLFKPTPLSIDSTYEKLIRRRSLTSQIENAYYSQKQDSVTEGIGQRFYGKADYIYRLDDYIRFPKMEDLFIEYIYEVIFKKKGSLFDIKVMNAKTRGTFTQRPLILLDGIPVFNDATVMAYNPLKIEKIEIVARRYFYGPLEAHGIISICTYEGNADGLHSLKKEKFVGVQPMKKYYSPNYTSPITNYRIPDYRLQLYWNPSLHISSTASVVEFFTSDQRGDFEVVIEGVTRGGKQLHNRQTIHVD